MKAPFIHRTIFARQLDSKRKKTNRWCKMVRQNRKILCPLSAESKKDLREYLFAAQNKYVYFLCDKQEDWPAVEPIEEEAINFAANMRWFCLPWTLAISKSEAECCFIDVDLLARFILDHYQIKLKITL